MSESNDHKVANIFCEDGLYCFVSIHLLLIGTIEEKINLEIEARFTRFTSPVLTQLFDAKVKEEKTM